ncbi:MAG: transporter [Nitrospirota bacterium]|nr:transporter [Nitrospirota bacterium]
MILNNHHSVSQRYRAGIWQRALLTLIIFSHCPTVFAEESTPNWQISANPSYSQGDYGGSTTSSVFYLPFAVKRLFSIGDLSVTVPFVSITSDGSVTLLGGDRSGGGGSNSGSGSDSSGSGSGGSGSGSNGSGSSGSGSSGSGSGSSGSGSSGSGSSGSGSGGGGSTISTTQRNKQTESGLGDVTLGARYYLFDEQDWVPSVNLTGRVKFPTANEDKGLGTGEFDYGFGTELAKFLTRDLILYLDGGYTFLGDPKGRNFRNQWNYDVGLGYYITDDIRASVFYEEYRAVVKGIPNARDIYGDLNYRITKAIRVNVGGFVGLSDSAADFGFAGGIRFRF